MKKLIALLIAISFPINALAATVTVTQTTAGSYTFTPPAGVTSATVKLWGGGGSGEGKIAQGTGAGGAGGSFAQSTISVTPGTSYPYIVAAANTGTTGVGAKGNASTFNSTIVVAEGGQGGGQVTPGTKGLGSTSASTGDTKYAGGNGANNATTVSSGGGGGGAGTTGAGGAAGTPNNYTAGTGTSLSGGNGAAGRTTAGVGANGTAAGGGGSGAWRSTATNRVGGNGAAGRAEISYEENLPPTVALNTPTDTATGQSTTPTLNFTGTDPAPYANTIEYNVQVDTSNTFNLPTRIQMVTGTNTGFASTVSASSITPTVGNALVVVVEADTVAQNGVTVSDSNGNSWSRVISTSVSATFDLEVWVALNVKAGATVITATDNGGGVDSLIIAEEWSNVFTVGAVDQSIGASGSSTALSSGASSATTNASEVVFGTGVVSGNVTMTAGTGYTNLNKINTTYSTLALESKTVTVTGAQTATMTAGTTGAWAAQVVTLKANSGPAIDKFSATDTGFTAGHPFASASAVDYTVQSALTGGTTYYWRVAGIDPTGSNTYGAWSATRSFTTTSGGGGSAIKSVNGLIYASVKSWNGLATSSIKSINGLQ